MAGTLGDHPSTAIITQPIGGLVAPGGVRTVACTAEFVLRVVHHGAGEAIAQGASWAVRLPKNCQLGDGRAAGVANAASPVKGVVGVGDIAGCWGR